MNEWAAGESTDSFIDDLLENIKRLVVVFQTFIFAFRGTVIVYHLDNTVFPTS